MSEAGPGSAAVLGLGFNPLSKGVVTHLHHPRLCPWTLDVPFTKLGPCSQYVPILEMCALSGNVWPKARLAAQEGSVCSGTRQPILNVEAWNDKPKTEHVHTVSGLGSSWSGSSARGGCGLGLKQDETQCSP